MSLNHIISKDFIPIPTISQGTLDYDMELCANLQQFASPAHQLNHCQTSHARWCSSSITFTMVSPDSLTPVTCAQYEPAVICEENGGANSGPANSGVLWMSVKLQGAGLWAEQVLLECKSVVRLSAGGHYAGLWQCSSPSSPSHRGAESVLLMGWCSSTAPSSSPCVTAALLVPPAPCSGDCAERHNKPSCAILEELDYHWSYHCMLPVVTRRLTEHQTREESVRNWILFLFWSLSCFCLSIAPVVTKAAQTIFQSIVLPKWTDPPPWSITDFVLYCE